MFNSTRISFYLFLLLYPVFTFSQSDKIYEVLTEPFVVRPLLLHKGHLQIHGGYRFMIANKEYDQTGQKNDLADMGTTSFSNDFRFRLTYGIIEYIQFSATMDYINTITTEPDLVIGNAGNIGNISEYDQIKGMSDLGLQLSIRVPPVIKKFDLSFSGGLSLPTGKYKLDKPTHYIDPPDPLGGSFNAIYKYHTNPGNGTLICSAGSSLQYSTSKLAIILNGWYHFKTNVIESISWNHRLNSGSFMYTEVPYHYKLGASADFSGFGAWQIFPWLATYGQFGYVISSGGWTEITGEKIAIPKSSLGLFSVGYEIQVSTHVRFEQFVNIPVFGKENIAELSFYTVLSYNLIPLKGLYY
ncbi:MAG: hypothetical protein AMS27_05780 [Bacteroides sp. SM23_62_1]|nr:MAG: hypothetical protein AMS27_05780 [Bacteroides sp. SM23_62_1]